MFHSNKTIAPVPHGMFRGQWCLSDRGFDCFKDMITYCALGREMSPCICLKMTIKHKDVVAGSEVIILDFN